VHPIFEGEFAAAPDAGTILETDSDDRILTLVRTDE